MPFAASIERDEVIAWVALGLIALAWLLGVSIWRETKSDKRLPWLDALPTYAIVALCLTPLAFALLAWWATYDEDVKGKFYESSAQVLPVLILALLIDKRLFASKSVGGKVAAGYLLVLLCIGEGSALYAVGQEPSDLTASLVIGALFLAALLLITAGIEHSGNDSSGNYSS